MIAKVVLKIKLYGYCWLQVACDKIYILKAQEQLKLFTE